MKEAIAFVQNIGKAIPSMTGEKKNEFIRMIEGVGMEERAAHQLLALGGIWATTGFPSVSLGHKHAAFLMSCQTKLLIEDLLFPWACFAIHVPANLLEMPHPATQKTVQITTIFVVRMQEFFRLELWDERLPVFSLNSKGNALLEAEMDFDGNISENSAKDMESIARLSRRLLAGVILELTQHREAQAHARYYASEKKPREGIPNRNTFTLTRDIKIDCRPYVSAYLREGGKSPTVQSLVRGHLKRQVCGPGGAERKLIAIEPYWRGPIDAPVAVKTHVLSER